MSELNIRTMAEMAAAGEKPDILFWVGCAGSFDDRAMKISRALVRLLNAADVKFAVLGTEESCSGDPAKRAGNEFLFQMQAMQNIEVMNAYEIDKIVTACPHCFNTLRNEYPQLGGKYEVYHHTEYLQLLINEGRLSVEGGEFKGKRISFHDPCYLGRGNGIFEAPRSLLQQFENELVEMKRCRSKALCCGAGGAQMFKESEKGDREVFVERAEEAIAVDPDVIATGCPFCNTMLSDGVKHFNKENNIKVLDISEIIQPIKK